MSSLWTPGGEHRVPRDEPTTARPGADSEPPATEQMPAGPAGATREDAAAAPPAGGERPVAVAPDEVPDWLAEALAGAAG